MLPMGSGHPRDQAEKLIGVFEEFDRNSMVESAQAFIQSDDPLSENSEYTQLIRDKLEIWEADLKTKMSDAREGG